VVDGERAVLHSEPDACGTRSSVATGTTEASSLDCVRGVRGNRGQLEPARTAGLQPPAA
jgi:hypothetical protein